jgi:hypothetical protein
VCTYEGGGSGPSYLTGWICVFMPFEADYETPTIPEHASWRIDENGNRLPPRRNEFGFIDTNDIPTGFVRVPIVINEQKLEFQAGFFGVNTPSPTTITPALDWRLVDQEAPKSLPKFWWDGANTDVCSACFSKMKETCEFQELTFPHTRNGRRWDDLEEALSDFNCDGCNRRFYECCQ